MNLEKIARNYLTPGLSSVIKNTIARPRFNKQLAKAKLGYREFGKNYNQNVLFVAGLPKSGTTWLEKMLFTLPGFSEIMIPEAVYFEQNNIGSHHYDFPKNTISRLKDSLSVLKLHVHGSKNNVDILHEANLNYVVLFRDLRDVAVSYFFYVKNTPWHPEYKQYKKIEKTADGLRLFAKNLLPAYKEWILSWSRVNDKRCLIIKYEDLKTDTTKHFTQILHHYGINLSAGEISAVVEKNSFKNLAEGRKEGTSDSSSFFRKGISGDWKNHFDKELISIYKEEIGELLIEFNYEKDLNW